ncbi:MAG: hypothetical protein K2N27_10535 [Ruminococcus sp.]|nr:hypothetical protein [Ruminococcus sp.]
MKKIISTLMISAIALSSLPLMSAPVTDNYRTIALAETNDLSSLASFLGADTAYFSFTNYTKNYLDTDMIITDCEDQSYGISMLQILSHNGVFAVSDIQQGAKNLADVQFDSELEALIESYQLTRFNIPQLRIKRAFMKNNTQTLVQTAMVSMTAKKYFHISLSISNKTHDVAGIGIASGSWTFNGNSYDKCILTVDSNTTSFDENYCIYVNTSDNTFCIPAYDDVTLTAVIADDDVLNYQGKLGEQVQPPVDIPDSENPAKIYVDTYSRNIIGEKYNEEYDEYIPQYKSTEEEYEVIAGDAVYDSFYLDTQPTFNAPVADSYKFRFKDYRSDESYLAFDSESKDGYAFVKANKYAESAEISVHKASIKTTDKDSINAEIVPTEPLYKSPFNFFEANAFYAKNFTITDREDGILLQSDSSYSANMVFGVCDMDTLTLAKDSRLEFRIEPLSRDLLLKYDTETQKIRGFIDKDEDDVYETEIQYGDTDCDGMLDADDASEILSIYSDLSTYCTEENPNYHMEYVNIFADFNGDGLIDASDASGVLEKYAEYATNNRMPILKTNRLY